MTHEQGEELLGRLRFADVRDVSLDLYALGLLAARRAGLILADTKFEFGTDETGALYLADEVLTPDSSRFWPMSEYEAGRPQDSFDKQHVRDYLDSLAWDKTPPGPQLAPEIIRATQERYLTAFDKITTTQL